MIGVTTCDDDIGVLSFFSLSSFLSVYSVAASMFVCLFVGMFFHLPLLNSGELLLTCYRDVFFSILFFFGNMCGEGIARTVYGEDKPTSMSAEFARSNECAEIIVIIIIII